jgi:hypothetical protein
MAEPVVVASTDEVGTELVECPWPGLLGAGGGAVLL